MGIRKIVFSAFALSLFLGASSAFAAKCGGIGYTGNDPSYCLKCHKPCTTSKFCKLTGKASECVKVPQNLPLFKGQLTCTTCHDMKTSSQQDYFLRFPKTAQSKTLSFCFTCHKESCYKRFNPHEGMWLYSGKTLRSTCAYCHGINNEDDPTKMCIGCHTRTPHPGAAEHFGKPITVTSLPSVDGKIHCITCHNPHASVNDEFSGHLLNGEGLKVAEANFKGHLKQVKFTQTFERIWFRNGPRKLMRQKTEQGQLCLTCHKSLN